MIIQPGLSHAYPMYNLQFFVGITIWNCFDHAAGVSGTLRTAQGNPATPCRGDFETKPRWLTDFGAANFQKTQLCFWCFAQIVQVSYRSLLS